MEYSQIEIWVGGWVGGGVGDGEGVGRRAGDVGFGRGEHTVVKGWPSPPSASEGIISETGQAEIYTSLRDATRAFRSVFALAESHSHKLIDPLLQGCSSAGRDDVLGRG